MRVVLCLVLLSAVGATQGWKSFLNKLQPREENLAQGCEKVQHDSPCNNIGENSGCLGCVTALSQGTFGDSWHQQVDYIGCAWDDAVAEKDKKCQLSDAAKPECEKEGSTLICGSNVGEGEDAELVAGWAQGCPEWGDSYTKTKEICGCEEGKKIDLANKEAVDAAVKTLVDGPAGIVFTYIVPSVRRSVQFLHTLAKYNEEDKKADAKDKKVLGVIGRKLCRYFILETYNVASPPDAKGIENCEKQLAGKIEDEFTPDTWEATTAFASGAISAKFEEFCKAPLPEKRVPKNKAAESAKGAEANAAPNAAPTAPVAAPTAPVAAPVADNAAANAAPVAAPSVAPVEVNAANAAPVAPPSPQKVF